MACSGPSSSSDSSMTMTNELTHNLGQVSLDVSSPILPAKATKPVRSYSLKQLEIMATIGNNGFFNGVCLRRRCV